jgi:hypothetical protein
MLKLTFGVFCRPQNRRKLACGVHDPVVRTCGKQEPLVAEVGGTDIGSRCWLIWD